MNILVIGASKGTGALAVKEALARGHRVTAFARSPEKLGVTHENLTLLKGDFHDQKSVEHAVPGHDAVLLTASVTSLGEFKKKPDYFSSGTRFAIDAMKAHSAKRLIVLSAFGAGDSAPATGFFLKHLLVNFMLKTAYEDHERQEKMVKESGLDWVIVQPTRLTDGPALRQYQKEIQPKPVPSKISRADVADFMVEACTNDTWLRKTVGLGG